MKLFRDLGYPSLCQYALAELGFSQANACNFIAVARKAREVPSLQREIQRGKLTVCKARLAAARAQAAPAGPAAGNQIKTPDPGLVETPGRLARSKSMPVFQPSSDETSFIIGNGFKAKPPSPGNMKMLR